MASAVDLALRNFKWNIEQVAPSHTSITSKKFLWTDFDGVDADKSSGTIRCFACYLASGGDEVNDTQDATRVIQSHLFLVEVAYSQKLDLLQKQILIAQDSHDLHKRLRDDRYYNGYDGAISADTGIYSRLRTAYEVIRGDQTWYLRQQWRCVIREVT
jgi:hypothetical protein